METERYLTLNPALEKMSSLSLVPSASSNEDDERGEKSKVTTTDDEPDSSASVSTTPRPDTLPLQYHWTVWEQVQRNASGPSDYKLTTREIATFSTVEAFWRLFQSLPQPSELLTSKRMMREEGGMQPVDAIMIFREGIEPMWEDPKNAIGGHFDYKVTAAIPAAQADEYWNNLVLGMVGGTLEPAEMVTGIRLVDKMERKMIRLELWFTDYHETEKTQQLKRSAAAIMTSKLNGGVAKGLECVEKPHMKQRR